MQKRWIAGILTLLMFGFGNNAFAYNEQATEGTYLTFIPRHSVYFYDVDDSYGWAYIPVDFLANGGVVTGSGQHLFYPQQPISRADFVLMLYRAYDMSVHVSDETGFTDVSTNDYFAKAVSAAKKLGIASGADDNFRPNEDLTRQDAMVFLKRTLDLTGQSCRMQDLSAFTDGDTVPAYARDAVSTLVGAGVVNGSSGRLNLNQKITRAEIAVLLYRALHLQSESSGAVYKNRQDIVNLCLGERFYTDVIVENYSSEIQYGLMECIQFRNTKEGYFVRLGNSQTIDATATYENDILKVNGKTMKLAAQCDAINVSTYSRLDGLVSTGEQFRYCRPSFLDGQVVAVYYIE